MRPSVNRFGKLHHYDESLPALEDLEWGKWALEQGYAIAYCAEAEVIHIHNESLAGIYNRYKREAMAFKRIYPHETFHERDLIRLFSQNVRSDWKEAQHSEKFPEELDQDHWLPLEAVLRHLSRIPAIRSVDLAIEESLLLPTDGKIGKPAA